MATNVQEIFGIQESILINIIQENLRNCAFVWNKVSPTLYQTKSLIINGFVWDVRIGKTRLSSGSYVDYLEVVKDGRVFVNLNSNNSSQIGFLFNTAEEMFSFVKNIEDEAISVLDGCRCERKYNITGMGGVVVGGSIVGDVIGFEPPSGSCKVQFSGVFLGDQLDCPHCVHPFNTVMVCCGGASTEPYLLASEVVGTGQTDNAAEVLPNADRTTFDSLAIWPNASLKIVDLNDITIIDVKGPYLIYNAVWKSQGTYQSALENLMSKTFVGFDEDGVTSFEDVFPKNRRVWSDDPSLNVPTDSVVGGDSRTYSNGYASNMHPWSKGSTIIVRCDAVTNCDEGVDVVLNGDFNTDLTNWDTTGDASWELVDLPNVDAALRLGKGSSAEQTIESLVAGSTVSLSYEWCLRNTESVSMLKTHILNPGVDPEMGFPAVCLVGSFVDGTLDYFCSGTLISSRHIATAAHCVDDLLDDEGRVSFGGTVYSSSKIHVHPSWSRDDINTDLGNDIAIIELDAEVVGITPIPISGPEPLVGDPIKLVGYGFTGGDSGYTGGGGTKRSGDQQVDEYTSTLLRFFFDVPGESSTAPGDSGGALLYEDSGQLYLTGIVSGGSGTGTLGLGTILFNTRVTAYSDWILQIVNSRQTIVAELRDSSNNPLTLLSGSGTYDMVVETPSCSDSEQLDLIAEVPSDGIVKIYFNLEGEVSPNTHNLYIDKVRLCYTEGDFSPPIGNCKVQFSGLLIGDVLDCESSIHPFNEVIGCTRSETIECSDIVGAGQTDDAENVLPNSDRYTFDSLAVWPATRLIIKRDDVTIIDVVGPKLIYYHTSRLNPARREQLTKEFVGFDSDGVTPLNDIFPVSSRIWSDDPSLNVPVIERRMSEWSKGTTVTIECPTTMMKNSNIKFL